MKYKAFGAIDLLVTLIITAVILLIGINSLKGISSLKLNDSPVDSESVQEHVDKTVNGGSLYFFSETEAENLKKKDYPVFFAEKGTKGTDHRPAWYIRFQ